MKTTCWKQSYTSLSKCRYYLFTGFVLREWCIWGFHFKLNSISWFMHVCSSERTIITRERKGSFDKLIQINIIAQPDHKWNTVRPWCTLPSKYSPAPFPEFLSFYFLSVEYFHQPFCVSWHTLFQPMELPLVLLSWYFSNHVIFDMKKGHCWA